MNHFASFMEKDAWKLKIERIKTLIDQMLSRRGTRRVAKHAEVFLVLDSLIEEMDAWYYDRCHASIMEREQREELKKTVAEHEAT